METANYAYYPNDALKVHFVAPIYMNPKQKKEASDQKKKKNNQRKSNEKSFKENLQNEGSVNYYV